MIAVTSAGMTGARDITIAMTMIEGTVVAAIK